jgi:protease-4
MSVSGFLKFTLLLLVFLMVAPSLIKNIYTNYQELLKEKTKIAVISIDTTLTEAEPYTDQLTKQFKNTEIKAIVLKIESGGGAAGTSQTIFNELKALKKQFPKPVIVFVENVCASGAYYIACAADTIITSPSAFIGSIGVYIPHPQLNEFIEQFKIKYSVVKTGAYKAVGDPLLQDSPEQLAMLQDLTNNTYEQFVNDVAASRSKLSRATATIWAEGKVFTGAQALELGLIDKVGSPSTVEQELRERIAIVGEIEWVKAPKPSSLSQFFSSFEAESLASLIVDKLHQTPLLRTQG